MKAELSTIQKTLTPEAAAVLTQSIGEAARRSHGQATPLHVAAMLLGAPGGLLRQACARLHNLQSSSSHPLRCRALELCFSVALDRLPAAAAAAGAEPSISNALMAALRRAQANQRRGCFEQHQPPLLAVKVDLKQLVMSILDDPSVSRVMREASFSSTAVKAAVEQSLPSPSSSSSATMAAAVSRKIYLNPRLHYPHSSSDGCGVADRPREDEVKRVLDIFSRSTKRNPILVGDCDLDVALQQVLQRIRSLDAPSPLRDAQILPFAKEIASAADHSLLPTKIRDLSSSIESSTSSGNRAVILDLGDLKWLAESPTGAGNPAISEARRATVQEMARLWKHFHGSSRLWFVGAAASATYLRIQVYHPTMENDLDLQPVPITSRFGSSNLHDNDVESQVASKSLVGIGASRLYLRRSLEIVNLSSPRTTLCPPCTGSYERELSKLVAAKSSEEEDHRGLPQWLRVAKASRSGGGTSEASCSPLQSEEEGLIRKQRNGELLLHREYCELPVVSAIRSSSTLSKPLSVLNPHQPPELNLTSLQSGAAKQPNNNPDSSLKIDRILDNSLVKTHGELLEYSNGCTQDMLPDRRSAKVADISDIDMFKRLFRGLTEKVSWQREAASAVAAVVMQCKSGNRKRHGGATKGDTWLLLAGPDRVGKKKMASALSELMFGTGPKFVHFGHGPCTTLGNDKWSNSSLRGRTSMDRIVEEVSRNPFSMIVLDNIDRADMLAQGKVKRAIQRGHLVDSYGREVGLGSIVFVLTTDWLPEELKSSYRSLIEYEETILDSARDGFELELTTGNKPWKRHLIWNYDDDDRPTKLRKECSVSSSLSLDLNLSVGMDVESREGSWNSSGRTAEHEFDKGRLAVSHSTSSLASELAQLVDDVVVFEPVHFAKLQRDVLESVSVKFAAAMGDGIEVRIDDEALDKITGGLWLTGTTSEDWAERVLVPSLNQLRDNLKHEHGLRSIRLSVTKRDRTRSNAKEWLPTTVAIDIDRGHDS